MDILAEFTNRLPMKKKHTPSGWTSFNGVCCHNRGHKPDRRMRSGFKLSGDGGFSYSCFNCSFKASWAQGRALSTNAKKLLEYLGASKEEIKKINFHCLKTKNNTVINNSVVPVIENKIINLPEGAKTLREIAESDNPPEDYIAVLKYLVDRNENLLNWYEYYWSPIKKENMNKRVIIPFFSNSGWLYGYSARTIDDKIKPKFMAQVSNNGYIFNQDKIYLPNRKFVILVEGLFDAISLDCCATMKQYISDRQIETLKGTDKKIIVVPDRDDSGKQLVEQAIKLGYCVSFPEWNNTEIKDVADAVKKFGRIATMQIILESVVDSELKIKLKMRGWFK